MVAIGFSVHGRTNPHRRPVLRSRDICDFFGIRKSLGSTFRRKARSPLRNAMPSLTQYHLTDPFISAEASNIFAIVKTNRYLTRPATRADHVKTCVYELQRPHSSS